MPSTVKTCLGLSILTILLSGSYVNSQLSSEVVKREFDLSESTLHKNVSTPKPQRDFRSTNIWRRNKPSKEDSKSTFSGSNELKSSQGNDVSNEKNTVDDRKRKRGQVKFSDHKVEESKKTVVVSRTRKREELPQDRPESTTKSYKKNTERTTTSQIISSMRTYKKNIPKLNVVSTTPRITTKEYETTISMNAEEDDYDEEEHTFNIDKYTSPEFHDVNNAYQLPLSPETTYFMENDYEDQPEEMETYERYTATPSSFAKDEKVGNAIKYRATKPSSHSTFNFDLTTPYVDSFDLRFKQMTKDIMQQLNASESDSTMYPNTQEVKKEMKFEEIISNEPNNPSKIYYKNTKKVTLSDSENEGSPNKKLSDVHGTSIYYESSMVSTETYPVTTIVDSECDNTSTTELPTTTLPIKALQISLIDSNAVTNDANSRRKLNDLPSNALVTPIIRRMQFTTPKTKRRISMKTKRIYPVSPTTSTKVDESPRIGSLRRKPFLTTISSEIDPIYQSDSYNESDQNIGMSTLSKRGSMKYTTNSTSSQKLESTLMAIPPTSTAWALITNKLPPTKNRTSAGTTVTPVTEKDFAFTHSGLDEAKANGNMTDVPPTATQYMTFSEMFGTSTQTVESSPATVSPTEDTYRETVVPVDDPPWTPIFVSTTNAHSQLPVINMTHSNQTPSSESPEITHTQQSTVSIHPTESAPTRYAIVEDYTEISITVSDVRSATNVFESITKLPTNTTTPLAEENYNSTTEKFIAEISTTTEQVYDIETSRTTEKNDIEENTTSTPAHIIIKNTVTEVSIDLQQTTQESTRNPNDDQFTATSDFYNTPHSNVNVQSKVTIYTTTPASHDEETTTKRQDTYPTEDMDNVASTTAATLSIEELPEVPITTYRPKHYTTTSQQEEYTTHSANIPSLVPTGFVDVLPLTTISPEPTTSDDYIFESGPSKTSTVKVPTSEAPYVNKTSKQRTSAENTGAEDVATTQEVDANVIEATVPSHPNSVATQTNESSEDSSNENNVDEVSDFTTTESREVITDDELPVDDVSTHSEDITQYVDGRNNLTLHKTDAITGRPSIEDNSNNDEAADDRGASVGVAVGVSVIGVVSLALLIALLVVVRRRSSRGGYGRRCTPVSLDACSVGSVRVGKGRSLEKRSYGNPAYENEVVVSHPMRVSALASFAADAESVWGEFSELQAGQGAGPGTGLGAVPPGCEDKNRYANVLPFPATRVPLARLRDDPTTEYINANYVSGPGNIRNYYIACQAPMANTVADFWRMIWEQNSRLILMLTEYMENGVETCYEYLPPSEVSDNKRTFGEFQVVLRRREHREKYAASALQLRHVPSGRWRDVHHMWYFWPAKGVPEDYDSVIEFLSECRGHMKAAQLARDHHDDVNGESRLADADDSSTDGEVHTYSPLQEQQRVMRARAAATADTGTNGSVAAGNVTTPKNQSAVAVSAVRPCVVHCSAGAGRTGAVLALDACARALETCGACDVPRAVRHLRAQRPQAVQNKHQYMFIYKVLSEYGNKLSGACFDTV